MPTSYDNAINEINGEFWNYWNNDRTRVLVGYVPEIRWHNMEKPDLPDGSKFWARVATQNVFEEQTTLSNLNGERRFTANGLVFVQIFCPKSTATAAATGRKLAEIAKEAFRGKSTKSCVWFRNVRIKEIPPEELFYRYDVIAEYEYDEVVKIAAVSGFVAEEIYDGGTF